MALQLKRMTKKNSMILAGTPEKVFPLLCPIREYEWIEGWACDLIFSDSGLIEQDCIFITRFGDGTPETWHVSHYEKNRFICFIRMTDFRTVRFEITLTDNHDGSSTAIWTQTFTALNERGNTSIESMDNDLFTAQIRLREQQLNHYLNTGTMLLSHT
ncbi:MAG TPA: hypothetical protein VF857_09130 [Spirochaetota bacterium]